MSTTRKAPSKIATLFESGNAIQLMISPQVKVFFSGVELVAGCIIFKLLQVQHV